MENRSYFVWEFGKPPEVAVEVVSNRKGGETGEKMEIYARVGFWYYAIFDPDRFVQKDERYLEKTDRRMRGRRASRNRNPHVRYRSPKPPSATCVLPPENPAAVSFKKNDIAGSAAFKDLGFTLIEIKELPALRQAPEATCANIRQDDPDRSTKPLSPPSFRTCGSCRTRFVPGNIAEAPGGPPSGPSFGKRRVRSWRPPRTRS